MGVRFEDHSREILAALDRGKHNALKAMGIVGVEFVQGGMYTLYGRPIYDTGNLLQSIDYDVDDGSSSVRIGTPVEYAPYVHDGTIRMGARPFLKDSLGDPTAQKALKEVAEEQLQKSI